MLSVEFAHWLEGHSDITGCDREVLDLLVRWADPAGVVMGLSKTHIQQTLHRSRHGVRLALTRLKKRGLIQSGQISPAGYHGTVTVWRLAIHETDEARYRAKIDRKIRPQVASSSQARIDLPLQRINTTEGLRYLIRLMREGRVSDTAQEIFIDAAGKRCAHYTYWARYNSRLFSKGEDVTLSLGSEAWAALKEDDGRIETASDPWEALLTQVAQKLAKLSQRGCTTMDPASLRFTSAHPLGEAPSKLEITYKEVLGHEGLVDLVMRLRVGGVPAHVAWAGTLRTLQLSVAARKSYKQTTAAKDPALAAMGLSPSAARALMNLMIGTRRGLSGQLASEPEEAGGAGLEELVDGYLPVIAACYEPGEVELAEAS